MSVRIGSRPSRSSTLTFFIAVKLIWSSTNWYMPGSCFSSHPVSLQMFRISRFCSAVALGIVRKILSTRYFLAAYRISSRPPTTGIPSMYRFHLFGLSSMMQTTLSLISLAWAMSRRMDCPAEPAPISITREASSFRLLRVCRALMAWIKRYAKRMPITKAAWRIPPRM